MNHVLVTTTSFGKAGDEPLKILRRSRLKWVNNPTGRTLKEHQTKQLLRQYPFVGLIAGTEILSRAVLKASSNLQVISRVGVGLDGVDLDYCKEKNIRVLTSDARLPQAVAELTIGLMLASLRAITLTDHRMRHGMWMKEMGSLLGGKRIGILGFGKVGKSVARLLRGFGVEIQFSDCRKIRAKEKQVALPVLLKTSDVITVHVSSGEELLGKRELKMMKRGSVLINTSRGSVVNEEALYQGLRAGHIGSAALDVFEKEPYYGKLAGLDNVVLTPHIGSYARETRLAMEIQAAENLVKALKKAGVA